MAFLAGRLFSILILLYIFEIRVQNISLVCIYNLLALVVIETIRILIDYFPFFASFPWVIIVVEIYQCVKNIRGSVVLCAGGVLLPLFSEVL